MSSRGNSGIAIILGALFALTPALASAATVNETALTPLYQQLIGVLEQELELLAPSPSLTVSPTSGPAPLTAIFTLSHLTKTEAIDFGDGHSTGSNGCVRNSLGYCDLHSQLVHTYLFPDTYTVSLYRAIGTKEVLVSTTSVVVGHPATSTTLWQ